MTTRLIDTLVLAAEAKAKEIYENARRMEIPCTEDSNSLLVRMVIEEIAKEYWAVDHDYLLEHFGLSRDIKTQFNPSEKPDVWHYG